MIVAECYHNRFHPNLDGQHPPCRELAVYRSNGLGNLVDEWTWCVQHPPHKNYRVVLR